ncbi:unnamed protein product [Blepharisma stoltei]|uniref:sn-1-specific diacylglycerol lipase n=1 Tax=Blepharisma stoltei TaxID=1481888 RepID=A0AAU9JGC6_9CILI|nr:unnamed protein product [Blepharisma stoltei]
MEDFKRNRHRIASAGSFVVDEIGFPLVKAAHFSMFKGVYYAGSFVQSAINLIDSVTFECTKPISNEIKSISSKIEKFMHSNISWSYELFIERLNSFDSLLAEEKQEVENYFSSNGVSLYQDSIISSEKMQTIYEISKLIKYNTREFPEMSMISFVKYLLTYISLQGAMRRVNGIFINWINHEEPTIGEMVYFSKYAVAAYGKTVVRILLKRQVGDFFKSLPDREVFRDHCKIEDEDIILCRFGTEKFEPAYIISKDHSKKSLVLTIRGTFSLNDIFTDLTAEFIEYTYVNNATKERIKGLVHFGMLNSAQYLSDSIKTVILEELAKLRDYDLVITGHSLGAGVASLLTLIWMSDENFQNIPTKTFAYGCPSVVSESLNLVLKDRILTCIHGYDFVAELSLTSISNLYEVIKRLKTEEDLGWIDIAKIAHTSNISDSIEIMEIINRVYEGLDENWLQPAGKVYQLYDQKHHAESIRYVYNRPSNLRFLGGFINPGSYKRIQLASRFFKDHWPDTYEKALLGLSRGEIINI